MPSLAAYASLAPFSLEELVEAVNSVLRARTDLKVTPRTVRYYIDKHLVPGPAGPPKTARYGFDHLVRVCGLRVLQDQGMSLEASSQIIEELVARGAADGVPSVEEWVTDATERHRNLRPGRGPTPLTQLDMYRLKSTVLESRRPAVGLYEAAPDRALSRKTEPAVVRRIDLGDDIVLEIDERADVGEQIAKAIRALRDLEKTT